MLLAAPAYRTAVFPHLYAFAAVVITAFTLIQPEMLTSCTISATGSYMIKIHQISPLYAITGIRLFQNIINLDLYAITSIIAVAPSLNPVL